MEPRIVAFKIVNTSVVSCTVSPCLRPLTTLCFMMLEKLSWCGVFLYISCVLEAQQNVLWSDFLKNIQSETWRHTSCSTKFGMHGVSNERDGTLTLRPYVSSTLLPLTVIHYQLNIGNFQRTKVVRGFSGSGSMCIASFNNTLVNPLFNIEVVPPWMHRGEVM